VLQGPCRVGLRRCLRVVTPAKQTSLK
jgi:hypothetical protein